jgi:hypothetical protein
MLLQLCSLKWPCISINYCTVMIHTVWSLQVHSVTTQSESVKDEAQTAIFKDPVRTVL